MFGSTRRIQFLESLISSRADEFSGEVQNAIRPASDMISAMTESHSESSPLPVRDLPEMILAEDAESLGEQIESNADGFQVAHNVRQQVARTGNGARSIFSQAAGQVEDTMESLSDTVESRDVSPAREVMKKKLNHFQIERLAQNIKDRLENELKTQKERWGEEP